MDGKAYQDIYRVKLTVNGKLIGMSDLISDPTILNEVVRGRVFRKDVRGGFVKWVPVGEYSLGDLKLKF